MKNTLKNKNKNLKLTTLGFTLIELLAVIVILAIIAIIATPIILGIVEDARRDAFLRSVELVVSTTDIDIVNKAYEDEYTYTIEDGNISNLEVGIKNTGGMNGSITYNKEGKEIYAVNNGVYCVIKTEGMDKAQIKDYVEGECSTVTIYANGQRVYFDVVKGTGCTMEEYASSYDATVSDFLNSKTGYNGLNGSEGQNNCLLFYAFNDDGGKNINLILDHNTLSKDYWAGSGGSSANGPITLLSKLRTATDNWNGTITPDNYTVYQESVAEDGTKTIYGDYTIYYKTEEYKARLITAQEIAQITGADTKEGLMFDESISDYNNSFLMETLTPAGDDTCTENCKYAWLYDRTNSSCTSYGCLNNAFGDDDLYGYWTGTSAPGGSGLAWEIDSSGNFSYTMPYGKNFGIRPVITVPKSKVSLGEGPVIPQS